MGISGLVRHYRESKILKPDDSRLQIIRDLEYVLNSVKRFKKSVRFAKTASVEDFEKLYNLGDCSINTGIF